MTKKFVKTDLQNLVKKDDRPQGGYQKPAPDRSARNRSMRTTTYKERTVLVDLRRFFYVHPADEQIKSLVDKEPNFFRTITFHPEQLKAQKFANDYRGYDRPVEEEEMPEWESQGQVELGEKISEEVSSKIQGVVPKNIGELKGYEKEFLQEEMRRKLNEQANDLVVPQIKVSKSKEQSSESEEEINIQKTVHFHHHLEAQDPNRHLNDHLVVVEDDDDNDRFKDSDNGSKGMKDNRSSHESDDIFGSASQGEKDESDKEEVPQAQDQKVNFGLIKFAQGEFSRFALGQRIQQDEPIWIILDERLQNSVLKTSKEMDRQYVSLLMKSFPWICFNVNAFNAVSYHQFHDNPDIKLFQTMGQNLRRLKNPQTYHQKNQKPRKFSDSRQQPQLNIPRNRKYSGYKPKY